MKIAPRLLGAALLAFGLGTGISILKLGFYCQRPSSEACVWGKAYRPIALPLESLVFGILLLGAGILLRNLVRRREL